MFRRKRRSATIIVVRAQRTEKSTHDWLARGVGALSLLISIATVGVPAYQEYIKGQEKLYVHFAILNSSCWTTMYFPGLQRTTVPITIQISNIGVARLSVVRITQLPVFPSIGADIKVPLEGPLTLEGGDTKYVSGTLKLEHRTTKAYRILSESERYPCRFDLLQHALIAEDKHLLLRKTAEDEIVLMPDGEKLIIEVITSKGRFRSQPKTAAEFLQFE